MLLSLHPNIIAHVENVVSLFSSPYTSSQKVRKCGGHTYLSTYLYIYNLCVCVCVCVSVTVCVCVCVCVCVL